MFSMFSPTYFTVFQFVDPSLTKIYIDIALEESVKKRIVSKQNDVQL